MAYNPNFAPWQGFTYSGTGGAVPTYQNIRGTVGSDLLNETYDAQTSLRNIQEAARLKKLRDLNTQLRMLGQAPGGDGTAAVALADRYQAPGTLTRVPDGWGGGGVTSVPRSQLLNNILSQISQDEVSGIKNSWYTPLEPYLSPFQKQLALARAQGQRQQQSQIVNAVSTNPNAPGSVRGSPTTPTANAVLTDQRVRQANDTRDAEKLIRSGGITSQQQLESLFPDADIKRLSGFLNAMQRGNNEDYGSTLRSADIANQSLAELGQSGVESAAERALREGRSKLGWFGERSTGKEYSYTDPSTGQTYKEPIFKPEYQALLDEYNQSVLDPQFDPTADQIEYAGKPYKGLQYDRSVGAFIPAKPEPGPVEPFVPNRVYRQDMPDQNFHTTLPRSPFYSNLPVVSSQQDYLTLPPGADYVDNYGRFGRVPGGHQTQGGQPIGLHYAPPVTNNDEFAQDFADNGMAAQSGQSGQFAGNVNRFGQVDYERYPGVNFGQMPDREVGNKVNFFRPSNEPVPNNKVDFGQGSVPAPSRGPDGLAVIQDPRQLQWLKPGEIFIRNGRRYKWQ